MYTKMVRLLNIKRGKLFGNNIPSELKDPRVTSFNAPGLDARFLDPQNLKLSRSPEMQGSLQGVSGAFRNQATELGGLQSLVQPGFGRLTQAGINAIRDARRSTMGDLKQNLARRRVSGSSFGADDISRTSAEFAKKENEFASQAFVQELALSNQLVNDKATAAANSFMQFIQQSNIESSFATQLASGVSNVLSNNAAIIGGMSNTGADRLLNVGGTGLGAFAALT
jgi:hypothetical protein